MGQRWGSSKVRGRGNGASIKILLQVDPDLWKKSQQMDAHKETIRPCYWHEGRIYTEEGKDVSSVKEWKRRGISDPQSHLK